MFESEQISEVSFARETLASVATLTSLLKCICCNTSLLAVSLRAPYRGGGGGSPACSKCLAIQTLVFGFSTPSIQAMMGIYSFSELSQKRSECIHFERTA